MTPAPITGAGAVPTGKGMFIWQMIHTLSGNGKQIAAAAKKAGLNWLAVKTHDGVSAVNGDLLDLAVACVGQGIALYGWGYCYGRVPAVEAQIAADSCNQYALAGYLIDAEVEYTQVSPANATLFVSTLRAALKTPNVGLCSYRYPQSHPELPWAALLAGCDFHAPQVYPLGATSPIAFGLQLTRSVAQLKALADLPVVPIGPVFGWTDPATNKLWEPSIAQLNDFDQTAHALRTLPGDGWWSWEASYGRADWWAAISAHDWTPPAPPPPVVLPGSPQHVAAHLRAMADDVGAVGDVSQYVSLKA